MLSMELAEVKGNREQSFCHKSHPLLTPVIIHFFFFFFAKEEWFHLADPGRK